MPRALIFGANGFVGGYLAHELAVHGYEVCGTDVAGDARCAGLSGYLPCAGAGAAAVLRVVAEFAPDAVVNLAAVSSVGLSWKIPQKTVEVNVNGAVNVLEAARKMPDPPKVLLVGSSEEYAPSERPLRETDPVDATNPYGISKVAQERFAEVYAERYGLRVYRTRSFNHTGPGQSDAFVIPSWCRQVAEIERSGRPGVLKVGNVDVRRDFSDVRDVARAYRMILESDYAGEVFNVGSGTAYPLREIAETICGFSSQRVEIEVEPALLRPSDNPVICCDRVKLRTLVGWEPSHLLKKTIYSIFKYEVSD